MDQWHGTMWPSAGLTSAMTPTSRCAMLILMRLVYSTTLMDVGCSGGGVMATG